MELVPIPKDFFDKFSLYDADARFLGFTPLRDFVIYKGPDGGSDDHWFPASKVLETVQGLLNKYRSMIESGPQSVNARREVWELNLRIKIAPLEALESFLLEAHSIGAGFYIAERD
jgi:hypothetical protein